MKKILLVDDDVAVTNYLMVFLMQTGVFEPVVVNDSRKVGDLLSQRKFDAVLLDMDMPNVSGIDILSSMRQKGDTTPVVVLTGVSDVDLAVRAMKQGAFDYLIKPVDDEKLIEVLDNSIEHSVLHKKIEDLPTQLTRGDLEHKAAFEQFRTQDQKMIRLFHQAEKIASSNLSIFIWGEDGTGKEAIARAIHEASPRRDKPFVAVDADSQTPDKFPSFLFGQARDWSGSREEQPGVLEEADGGTMFLNYIDALSLPVQVRLKRVIQTGEFYRESSARIRKVDVRMIVSSVHDLTGPEFSDKFSSDLLYHLMINSIRIPPLRDRVDDIPLLAQQFLEEEALESGRKIRDFTDDFIDILKKYSFPGNVQELQTIIASAVVHEETDRITANSLPSYIKESAEGIGGADIRFMPKKLDAVVQDHILRTISHFNGDRAKAADELGISEEEIDRIAGE